MINICACHVHILNMMMMMMHRIREKEDNGSIFNPTTMQNLIESVLKIAQSLGGTLHASDIHAGAPSLGGAEL